MLDVLAEVERELPNLLRTEEGWQTLAINYHPPHVERVVRRWNDYRIYLHRILPCTSEEALFHPHPWPSAMRILSGVYEMAVGYGPGSEPPPVAAKLIASGDLCYEMTDPDSWHYVRPIDDIAMTIMVTGPPWDRWAPGANRNLRPLADTARNDILEFFRDRYPIS